MAQGMAMGHGVDSTSTGLGVIDVKVYELINILSAKLGDAEIELDGSITIDGEVVAGEPKEPKEPEGS